MTSQSARRATLAAVARCTAWRCMLHGAARRGRPALHTALCTALHAALQDVVLFGCAWAAKHRGPHYPHPSVRSITARATETVVVSYCLYVFYESIPKLDSVEVKLAEVHAMATRVNAKCKSGDIPTELLKAMRAALTARAQQHVQTI